MDEVEKLLHNSYNVAHVVRRARELVGTDLLPQKGVHFRFSLYSNLLYCHLWSAFGRELLHLFTSFFPQFLISSKLMLGNAWNAGKKFK